MFVGHKGEEQELLGESPLLTFINAIKSRYP